VTYREYLITYFGDELTNNLCVTCCHERVTLTAEEEKFVPDIKFIVDDVFNYRFIGKLNYVADEYYDEVLGRTRKMAVGHLFVGGEIVTHKSQKCFLDCLLRVNRSMVTFVDLTVTTTLPVKDPRVPETVPLLKLTNCSLKDIYYAIRPSVGSFTFYGERRSGTVNAVNVDEITPDFVLNKEKQ